MLDKGHVGFEEM